MNLYPVLTVLVNEAEDTYYGVDAFGEMYELPGTPDQFLHIMADGWQEANASSNKELH